MFQVVEKVCFFRNVAYSQTLTPNPFPSGRAVYALLALRLCNRGRLLSVRPAPTLFDHLYASLHRAFGHTRPASVPGLNVGLPPSPSKDACSQSHTVAVQGRITTATQSRCTMQRHKWLSMHRCSDTNDWRPALGLRPKQGRFGCLPKVISKDAYVSWIKPLCMDA